MYRRSLLIASIALGACASSPPPSPVAEAPAAVAAPAASRMPNDVHWVRNSAEFRAALLQTYALAGERLAELAAGHEPGTWAVALDADETVISNSQFEKEIFELGRPFSPESWNAWVHRREATAQPGAHDFLERIHTLGGKIAIVTNRGTDLCADTEANFHALDLPFDLILCRTDDSRKEARWDSIEDGTAEAGLPPLEILMWLGDNIQDFPDWDQEKRFETDEAFRDFGSRYFVIPNPMYGTWLGNPRQ